MEHPTSVLSLLVLQFVGTLTAHLYLTDDICEPFAACVFTLDRFVCNSVCDDEEDFREVGVIWSQDDGVVAVERR